MEFYFDVSCRLKHEGTFVEVPDPDFLDPTYGLVFKFKLL